MGNKEKSLKSRNDSWPLFLLYARKPRQSRSMSLATISAITGSPAALKPSEKPYLLKNGFLAAGKGAERGTSAGAGPPGPLRRPAVSRRCSDIMSSARSKRGISVLLTPSPLLTGPAAPGIMSFARKISDLRGVLKSSACLSFSAIYNLSCSYQFIHLNIKTSIIQAGTRNKRGRLRGKKIRACPPRRPSSINRLWNNCLVIFRLIWQVTLASITPVFYA